MRFDPIFGKPDPRGSLPFLPYSRQTRTFISLNFLFLLVLLYGLRGYPVIENRIDNVPDQREYVGTLYHIGWMDGRILHVSISKSDNDAVVSFPYVPFRSSLRKLPRGTEARIIYGYRPSSLTIGKGLDMWVDGVHVYSREYQQRARDRNRRNLRFLSKAAVVGWVISWCWWLHWLWRNRGKAASEEEAKAVGSDVSADVR